MQIILTSLSFYIVHLNNFNDYFEKNSNIPILTVFYFFMNEFIKRAFNCFNFVFFFTVFTIKKNTSKNLCIYNVVLLQKCIDKRPWFVHKFSFVKWQKNFFFVVYFISQAQWPSSDYMRVCASTAIMLG